MAGGIRRRKRPPREYPLLASDVARNYIVLGILMPATVVISIGVAITVGRSETDQVVFLTSVFIAWSVFCIVAVLLIVMAFARAAPDDLRRWLDLTTPRGTWRRLRWALNGGGAIYWASGGAAVAIATVVSVTLAGRDGTNLWVVAAALLVVVSSFALIVVSYAVGYARYDVTSGGLRFPGTLEPRFADYLYLAGQVSTTFSASDVEVTGTTMRRIVTIHSMLAFAFNTVVVAVLVSVLIGGVAP